MTNQGLVKMNLLSWFTRVALLAALAVAAALDVAHAEPLVIYSGRGESLVGPIFEAFTAESGIEVDVRYNKTPAIATQVLTERQDSAADVIFLQESGYLGTLAANGLLATLPRSVLGQVDPRFRDEQGRWIGTSGRARVLVYNTQQLAPEDLPRSLSELRDPKWKGKLGWAPGNASFQAHVSALRHLWGEAQTRSWLESVGENNPTVYPKNSPQVRAAASGEIQIGWVNHYYLLRAKNSNPEIAAANYSFPTASDAGNILMVAGVAVREGTPRMQDALALVSFLTGERAQRMFAEDGFEYPTRVGAPTHADVPPLDSLRLATIDQSALTDVGPTLELLRDLGLQ